MPLVETLAASNLSDTEVSRFAALFRAAYPDKVWDAGFLENEARRQADELHFVIREGDRIISRATIGPRTVLMNESCPVGANAMRNRRM